jgi:hypothetical protein
MIQHLQGAPQLSRALVVRADRQRLVGGALAPVHRPGRGASRHRLEEVMGDLRRRHIRASCVVGLERLAGAAVQPHPPRDRKLLVERLLDQRVREGEAAATAGRRHDHARRERLSQGFEQRLARRSRERLEHRHIEAPARHGRRAQGFVARRGETIESPSDGVADAFRQRQRRQRLRSRVESALVDEQPDHLGHEERIAAGALDERRGHLGPERRSRDRRDELRHCVRIEAAELEALHVLPARESTEESRERPVASHFDIAIATHQQDGRGRAGLGEEVEEVERVGVAPLQIVDCHGERPARRRARQESRHALEEAKARLIRAEVVGAPHPG